MSEVRSNGGLGDTDVGLLQLNSSIVTGAKNTRALDNIFNKGDYVLLSFLDLLAEVLDQNTFQRAQKYLVLLNGADTNSRLLQDINPLRNADVKIALGGGKFKQEHVQFMFRREIQNGKVSRVLVFIKVAKQIEPVVEKPKQEVKPSKSSKTNKPDKPNKPEVTETVSEIVEMDESIIEDFLAEAIPALELLPTIVRRSTESQSKMRESLDYIGRSVHKIKGDAAILNFDEVVRLLHKFEDNLEPIKNKPSLSKSDFVDFLTVINKVIVRLKKFSVITEHVGTTNRKKGDASAQSLFQRLQSFVEKLSREIKKDVRLVDEGFEQAQIPISLQKDVMSMVVQLLRNAVVHGIEDKATRRAGKKQSQGAINLGVRINFGEITITVRDDGASLDLKKIKQVAIKSGKYPEEEINNYTSSQLRNLILQPGFTTSSKIDVNSGRGMGLDIVNTTVKDLGGSLVIRAEKGISTEFTMTFPVAY